MSLPRPREPPRHTATFPCSGNVSAAAAWCRFQVLPGFRDRHSRRSHRTAPRTVAIELRREPADLVLASASWASISALRNCSSALLAAYVTGFASALEAPVTDVLVWHSIAGEMERRTQRKRGEAGVGSAHPAHRRSRHGERLTIPRSICPARGVVPPSSLGIRYGSTALGYGVRLRHRHVGREKRI
jgi:hypothetical protein